MTHKNRKKLRTFMFCSAGCSLVRAIHFFPIFGYQTSGSGSGSMNLNSMKSMISGLSSGMTNRHSMYRIIYP